MGLFVGLDVSQKTTSVCVVDRDGQRRWRGQCQSTPIELARTIERQAGNDACVGIETGAMTPWLVHELRARNFDVVCIDARHAKAALQMQLNKTDQNDAEGLAQIMRTGWYRTVHVKSFDTHRIKALLGARLQLVGMATKMSNHIRGVLKTFGMLPGAVRGNLFATKVETLIAEHPDVALIIRPMLTVWLDLRKQIAAFDQAIRSITQDSPTCRLLMSVPGIGPITVLAYISAIEDPSRFQNSRSVGAHLGLTPRQYQSGEIDISGRISKCGDTLARVCLYEAATVIMTRLKRPSSLKTWAEKLVKRSGSRKARVALARKLAVILHSIWQSGELFCWDEQVAH
jgi:transposase